MKLTTDRHKASRGLFATAQLLDFDARLRGPRRNIATTVGVEKLEWFGYPTVKKVEDKITRFDRIHERDKQTDGWPDKRTDGQNGWTERLSDTTEG